MLEEEDESLLDPSDAAAKAVAMRAMNKANLSKMLRVEHIIIFGPSERRT
jgi:hypothetical protein